MRKGKGFDLASGECEMVPENYAAKIAKYKLQVLCLFDGQEPLASL